MQKTILTRMGDGERLKMSPSEIKAELQDGSQNAASMARIPALTEEEIEQLSELNHKLAQVDAMYRESIPGELFSVFSRAAAELED